MARAARSPVLFDLDAALPDGFVYRPDFLSPEEEQALLELFGGLSFGEVRMHGVTARRRVLQYGWRYSFDRRGLSPGPPTPPPLLPVRDRAATLVGRPAADLSEVLLTEYQPGATIGWHRDAPAFGLVVGVSLGSACRMRFRRGALPGSERREVTLDPRSVYVIDGPARTDWQHSIPATDGLRYSITFRTLRGVRS